MEQTVDVKRVIDTVKKLVNLTKGDRTGREGEVEAAMGKIQLLLAKHNLSMMDVETETEDETSKIVKRVDEMQFVDREYQQKLARAVATLCDCDFIVSITYHWVGHNHYKRKRLMYIGYTQDVHIAFALYNELLKTVDKMGADYSREMKDSEDPKFEYYNNNDWNVLRLSYKCGVCERLSVRATEAKRKQDGLDEKEKEQYGALIRLKDCNIKKWMDDNMNISFSKSRFSRTDFAARQQGYKDGDKVNLTGRKSIK